MNNKAQPGSPQMGTHILGMEPDSVLRHIIRTYFASQKPDRAIGVKDIIAVAMEFNQWLVSTNETLQKLALDNINITLPSPIIVGAGLSTQGTSLKKDIESLREIITPETKQAIDDWRMQGTSEDERAAPSLRKLAESIVNVCNNERDLGYNKIDIVADIECELRLARRRSNLVGRF